jgi:AcrR family transcriptional regulator
MKRQRLDRRVQRTRQLLRDALLQLILEKGYAAITVQDILDRANLGRSTFYVHYRDKDDLLISTFERLKEMFEEFDEQVEADQRGPKPHAVTPTLALFQHAGENRGLYKALAGKRGGEVVQKYLYQFLADLMKEHLKRRLPNDKKLPAPREIVVHHFISSYLALLTWWLDHDMPYTAEQMDGMFRQLNQSTFQVFSETA